MAKISTKATIVFLLLMSIFISTDGYKMKHRLKYGNYIKLPMGSPSQYPGRLAGYPAPPSGKWPYPAKVHPATLEYKGGSIGFSNFGSSVSENSIFSSPNDVAIDPNPFQDISEWDIPLDMNVCRNLKGLTKSQLHICHKYTDVTAAAAIGLTLAVKECRKQFKNNRWNCTALDAHIDNPHAAPIMDRGYSETAFIHALSAAGVTHSVARACAAGKLSSCACGNVKGKRAWKWSGCHDNTKFGARFSRMFLDIREKAKDILSFTHLFNNEVGRKIVRRNRQVHCKCHGLSGSCEVRTCWKAVPTFTTVGDILSKKYRMAKSASKEVFGNSADQMRNFKPIRKEISLESPLLYAEESPSFCTADQRLSVVGTTGRECNTTGTGFDSCDALCCGRGYNIKRRKTISKCQCKFKWCCQVSCKDCITEEWITVCK